MTKSQSAAYVFSQAVAALAEIEAMKAANVERDGKGLAQAYPEKAFFDVIDNYQISHNAVLTTFNSAYQD